MSEKEFDQYEVVEGLVSDLIFQNEENGYTILKLERDGEELTVVGAMPGVSPGEFLTVRGSWVRHPSYGRQFKSEIVERRLPQGMKEIFHYLSSGAIKGVGKLTARRLIEEFGDEVLDIIEADPEKLVGIKGITPKRAQQIHESFLQQMGMRRLLEFLGQHNLPMTLAAPLFRSYGGLSLEIIKSNPYELVGEDFNLPFQKADELALQLGVEIAEPLRLEAGLLFTLSDNLNNGHCFLPRGELIANTARLLDLIHDSQGLETSLDILLERDQVVIDEIDGEVAVYLPPLYDGEYYIANRIGEMSYAELYPPEELPKVLENIQKSHGISYSPQQESAVMLAAKRQVMLLTGGPGTGKTTCLRGVLALFDHLGLETALAAPTGRAAKRLGELCEAEASTIHRLLETGIDPTSGKMIFSKNEEDPLNIDAVIVDETSMVDVLLMAALLNALPPNCRLVLVGDPDQLPSVGAGNLFSDLIASEAVPTVRLTEIFRQAQESAIVRSAHLVNGGQLPELAKTDGDFFFLSRPNGEATVETIVDLCRRRLPERMGIPADQIQVLSPTRRRSTGTAQLNAALQAALNPPSGEKGEKQFGDWIFRAGDRVMQVKNNYDILWRENATGDAGMGIFNGDIGRILEIDRESVTVDFEGRTVEYSLDMLSELEPAFAVTVHKSQGSEYRAVILATLDGASMLMTRGVLYTAITRARTLFIAVGSPYVVQQMVANNRQTMRYSSLKFRLCQLHPGLIPQQLELALDLDSSLYSE